MSRAYYRAVTIDHTKVPSTQTNFPVLVSVTHADLKSVANGGHVESASAFDLGFFADTAAATPLLWEVESYDGTTGALVAWVKIASLSSSVDTVIYLHYGDATITTLQSTASGVWDANYKGVFHLGNRTSEWALPTRQTAGIIAHGGGTVLATPPGVGWKNAQVNDFRPIVDPNDATKLVGFFMAQDGAFDYTTGTNPTGTLARIGRATATLAGFSQSSTWTVGASPVISETYSVRPCSRPIVVGTTIYLYCLAYKPTGNEIVMYQSTDSGLTWGSSITCISLTGQGVNETGGYIANASVIYTAPSTFEMVYGGGSSGADSFTARYRTATSSTGLGGSWTKTGTTILTCGNAGSPDYFGLEWFDWQKWGSYYVLTYEAAQSVSPFQSPPNTTVYSINVAFATVRDGPYTKSGLNPWYSRSGVSGRFDESHVATGAIVTIDGSDYLAHCGGFDAGQANWDISLAKLNSAVTTIFGGGLADSTSSSHDLTPTGVTTVSGKFGNAARFDGSQAYAGTFTCPTTAIDNIEIECWVRAGGLSQNGMIWHNGSGNNKTAGVGYGLGINNSNGTANGAHLVLLLDGVAWRDTGYVFTETTTYHHVRAVRESGTWKFYVDDVATSNSGTYTDAPNAPVEYFTVGRECDFRYAHVDVQGLRVSNVVRSTSWRTAQYNNESSPSTFHTLGSEVSLGGGGVGTLGGGPPTATISAAQFAQWCADGCLGAVWRCDLNFVYESSGAPTTGTVHVATARIITEPTDTPANATYLACLRKIPEYDRQIDQATFGGRTRNAVSGSVVVDDADGLLTFLLNAIIDGQSASFYLGRTDWPISQWPLIFLCVCEKAERSARGEITISLRDVGLALDQYISGTVIGGTGPNATKSAPILIGTHVQVEAIVETVATLKYRFASANYYYDTGAAPALTALYDNGVLLRPSTNTTSTNTDNVRANTTTDLISILTFNAFPLNDEVVRLTFATTQPTTSPAFVNGGSYWVVNSVLSGSSGRDFQLSLTKGGTPIDILTWPPSSPSVAFTINRYSWYDNRDGSIILAVAPVGVVTCSVANVLFGSPQSGNGQASDLYSWLYLTAAGYSSGSYAGNHGSYPIGTVTADTENLDPPIGVRLQDPAKIGDVMQQLALSSHSFVGSTRLNKFTYGRIRPHTPTLPGADPTGYNTPTILFTDADLIADDAHVTRLMPMYKSVTSKALRNYPPLSFVAANPSYSAELFRAEFQSVLTLRPTPGGAYSVDPYSYHASLTDSPAFETLIASVTHQSAWQTFQLEKFLPFVDILTFTAAFGGGVNVSGSKKPYELELGDLVYANMLLGLGDSVAAVWQVLGVKLIPISKYGPCVGLTLVQRRLADVTGTFSGGGGGGGTADYVAPGYWTPGYDAGA